MPRRRSLACIVLLWISVIGVVGVGASIIYNRFMIYWANFYYATSPADTWLLVGGVNSTSASFRVRLTSNGVPLLDSDDSILVVSTHDDLRDPFYEQSLTENNNSSSVRLISGGYGLYGIHLTDLDPLTRYYYGVQSLSSGTILEGTFRTPAPEGTAFNFTVGVGASAWTGSKAYLFDAIRNNFPNMQLFLHTGNFHFEDINTNDTKARLDAISTVLNSPPQAQLYRSVPLDYVWDDHDFLGPQFERPVVPGARETALSSYQMAIPHYPLAESDDMSVPVPIYHAFTIGTIRFIVSDLQSESKETSIYSEQQKKWLLGELRQADQYDFVIWVTSKPWIGIQTPENNAEAYGSWLTKAFAANRSELSTFITNEIGGTDGPQNLLAVSGDVEMVAFDDGTNTYFGSQDLTGNEAVHSFPILQSAPLDRLGSAFGGPYSSGCMSVNFERTFQFSMLSFQFFGDKKDACIQINSYRVTEWEHFTDLVLSTRLCGSFFQPAVFVEKSPSPECKIQKFTVITLVLSCVVWVSSVFLVVTIFFAVCGEESQGMCKRVFCSALSVAVALICLAAIVFAAIFTPFWGGVGQYNMRISNLIAAATVLVMMCAILIISRCCFKQKEDSNTGEGDENGDKVESSGNSFYDQSVLLEEGLVGEENPKDSTLDNKEKLASEPGPNSRSKSTSSFRPYVVRKASSSKVSKEQLPVGVILTGAVKLHKEGLTGKGVKVGVIDSGIDDEHPGFNGQVKKKVWLRFGEPGEEDDHGTHVAGIIHLVAPEAEIYDYRVFGDEGVFQEDQAVAKAIREATDDGCKVINMSICGPVPNGLILDAVKHASSKGVVMLCAAGNGGPDKPVTNEICFPCSYEECIGVAAISKRNGFPVALYSSSNPLIGYAMSYASVGVDVISFKPGGGYQSMTGSSLACPHVSGLVACLMTNGHTSAADIKETLDRMSVDIDVVGFDNAASVRFATYLPAIAFDKLLPRKRQQF